MTNFNKHTCFITRIQNLGFHKWYEIVLLINRFSYGKVSDRNFLYYLVNGEHSVKSNIPILVFEACIGIQMVVLQALRGFQYTQLFNNIQQRQTSMVEKWIFGGMYFLSVPKKAEFLETKGF